MTQGPPKLGLNKPGLTLHGNVNTQETGQLYPSLAGQGSTASVDGSCVRTSPAGRMQPDRGGQRGHAGQAGPGENDWGAGGMLGLQRSDQVDGGREW